MEYDTKIYFIVILRYKTLFMFGQDESFNVTYFPFQISPFYLSAYSEFLKKSGFDITVT